MQGYKTIHANGINEFWYGRLRYNLTQKVILSTQYLNDIDYLEDMARLDSMYPEHKK
jgi:hypothetical protein